MVTGVATSPPSGRALHAAVFATAAFAGVALWVGDQSSYGRFLTHQSAVTSPAAAGSALAFFMTGWSLMLMATLVPTATALVDSFGRVVRHREHPARLQVQLVVGFLGVWIAFGYGVFVADAFVHTAVDALPLLAERPQFIAGGVLAVAGLYQFSELKRRCIERCRSPETLLFRHWGRARAPGRQAARVGVAYGVSCLGCCWGLMLLMFAFAMGSIAWMAGLAAVMAVEKNWRHGAQLTRPLGGVLLAAATAVVVMG